MTATSRLASRPTRLLLPAIAAAAVSLSVFAPSVSVVQAATPAQAIQSQPVARQADSKDKRPMLTDEDINLIKVYEVKFEDEKGRPPKVRIPRRVLAEMLEKYRENNAIPRGRQEQAAFFRKDGHEQLKLMFKLRAREYYKDVRISSPIASLRDWNRLHESYVLSYFGKHFGDGRSVPGFELLPVGREDKRIAMTNFYLLTQTSINGIPMIDRDNPEESLLLQWGLPKNESKFSAPDVERWEPYFKDTDDERFVAAVDWIKSLVKVNQGSNYGVDFTLKKQDNE